MADHRTELVGATAVAVAGAAGFVAFAVSLGVTGADLLFACAAFFLIFLPYPALAVSRWADRLASVLGPAPRVRAAMLLALIVVVYAVHTGLASGPVAVEAAFVWRFMLYAWIPLWVLGGARARAAPLASPVRFAFAILALWLPVEFGWLPAFTIPAGHPEGLNVIRLVALDVALVLFIAVAPVPDLGFTFRLTRRDVRTALLAFAAFAVVGLPLGLGIGFVRFGFVGFAPVDWVMLALVTYLVIAVPEEFLFRGLIQNLLEKRWRWRGGRIAPLLIAATIFGIAHLDHAPVPNVRYAVLATLAGAAYGWVWMRTRKVTASALAHTAVNWVWGTFLVG